MGISSSALLALEDEDEDDDLEVEEEDMEEAPMDGPPLARAPDLKRSVSPVCSSAVPIREYRCWKRFETCNSGNSFLMDGGGGGV